MLLFWKLLRHKNVENCSSSPYEFILPLVTEYLQYTSGEHVNCISSQVPSLQYGLAFWIVFINIVHKKLNLDLLFSQSL